MTNTTPDITTHSRKRFNKRRHYNTNNTSKRLELPQMIVLDNIYGLNGLLTVIKIYQKKL